MSRVPAVKSMVVLPFVNRSPDPENEYFNDGLTEEVISDLSGLSGLQVVSRNSAMALKGTAKDTSTLARELGVSHLVTGTVRRAGSALRVTAELVDAQTDMLLWSEKYAGSAEDVFGIQEQISQKIASALQVALTAREAAQVAERPINDAIAHDCYLRARQEMYGWTAASTQRALRLVDDALAIVGDNALLFATKGQIYFMSANVMLTPTDESLGRAQHYADRAFALEPNLAQGIFVRGLITALRGRVEQALDDLRRAHELQPGDANLIVPLARFSVQAGHRAGHLVEELVRIDPLTPSTYSSLAAFHAVNGRFQEGAASARRAIEMARDNSLLQIMCGWWIAEAGCREEAVDVLRGAAEALEGTVGGTLARFLQHAAMGDSRAVLEFATPQLEQMRHGWFNPMVAAGHAAIGHTAEAIRWTRIAIDCGFINYPCLARHDPFLANVRLEPEFQHLMDGLRRRWEAVDESERQPLAGE